MLILLIPLPSFVEALEGHIIDEQVANKERNQHDKLEGNDESASLAAPSVETAHGPIELNTSSTLTSNAHDGENRDNVNREMTNTSSDEQDYHIYSTTVATLLCPTTSRDLHTNIEATVGLSKRIRTFPPNDRYYFVVVNHYVKETYKSARKDITSQASAGSQL
ncbi:MAG: hypothetical protein M1820_002061 [Bogoriella megaspora]|nr:MAG: hypothetical protein M1820_002061 [Bogoriella megaspora]